MARSGARPAASTTSAAAVARGQRRCGCRFARLARASLLPELRRQLRALSGLAYSAWAWFCFLLLALPTLAGAALLRNPALGLAFQPRHGEGLLRLCRLPLAVRGPGATPRRPARS